MLEALGHTIRTVREAADSTQEDLAYESGLTVSQLSRIERGLSDARLSTLSKIAAGLSMTPGDLLNAAEASQPSDRQLGEPSSRLPVAQEH